MGKYKKICDKELDKVKTGPGGVALLAIITAILAIAVLGIVGTSIKQADDPGSLTSVMRKLVPMILMALPFLAMYFSVFYFIVARERIVRKKLSKALESVELNTEEEIDAILENMTAVDEEIFINGEYAFNFGKPLAVRFNDIDEVRLTYSNEAAYYDILFVFCSDGAVKFMECDDRALFDKMTELFGKYVPDKLVITEQKLPKLQ